MNFPKEDDREISTKGPRESDRTLASTYVLHLPVDRVLILENTILLVDQLKDKG